ncbi:PEP-CTERM sorting domain-containing protein [Paucibacter sp. DJ1R-11]|uniref:PEP-CTERM sorting domain-containing protein n=1 Tax=Paucibacter sp. DJ1R-11 TaxID=2893556 RepID=UPI0021E47313|nr:PEP-CTERM sorting domain-containing protein [Paucibacter sp. DJ1R-11]MCV2364781.1 PEP-CTERM sorting domain-containing protein [Paucibacter sp. DJ1R-11]
MNSSALRLTAIAGLVLVSASSAFAATYTNVPTGPNTGLPFASFGNAGNPSGDSPKVGEVFSLSAGAQLSSFSFYALGNQSLSLQLNVARWNPASNAQNQASNGVGPALLTTAAATVGQYNAAGGYTALSFDNLGLNLNANTKYIAYLSSTDANLTGVQLSRTQTAADSSGFGIGLAYLSTTPGSGWQLPFNGNGFLSLQYSAETVAAPVPEPKTYALLVLGLGLIGVVLKRRKADQA